MSRRSETLRWAACFTLALGFHAAGAAALLARWNESSDPVANAPLIMIDLAPVPVAPQTVPTELPPDPVQSKQQTEPEPEPEKPAEKVEVKPEPEPVVLPEPRPEPPKETKKKPRRQASLASAPSSAERKAESAAAPMPGAFARDPQALPNWTSQLVAKLERYKRYPPEAQARGEQGVARLAFSVDRGGGVHRARIVSSSGSSALDRETLMLVERAAPLPPPPADVAGAQISVVVPIRYNIR